MQLDFHEYSRMVYVSMRYGGRWYSGSGGIRPGLCMPFLSIVHERVRHYYEYPRPKWSMLRWLRGFRGAIFLEDISGVSDLFPIVTCDSLR